MNNAPRPFSRRSLLQSALASATVMSAPALVRAQSAAPIKVGFIAPLTGPYGADAQLEVLGAQIAIKQFNDAGGLNGRLAELLVRDCRLNAGEGASRALELAESDKVVEQNVALALEIADRAVIIDHGEVVHRSTASELLADREMQDRYCAV